MTERLVHLEAVEDVNATAERTARENRERADRLRQEADQLEARVPAA